MFKILVIGAKGQVGSEIIKLSPKNLKIKALDSKMLDITDRYKVFETITSYSPDLIINAAAYTAVDLAENNLSQAYLVNAKGSQYLAEASKIADIPLFHISTDYVFNGSSESPYIEGDLTDPLNVYGKTKLCGEKNIQKANEKHIILRTSWVFGLQGNNFVKTMLKMCTEHPILTIISDQHGCPTSATSIASVLLELAYLVKENQTLPWGIYHFRNSPDTTWFNFANHIFEASQEKGIILDKPKVHAISTSEYVTAAARPMYSVLDCNKIEKLLEKPIPSWKNELDIFLNNL